jgi:hypothetical protein
MVENNVPDAVVVAVVVVLVVVVPEMQPFK